MSATPAWKPDGRRAALCLAVDDVHPAPSALGALDLVRWLQDRHPLLRVTLFTTPDWRAIEPHPSRHVRHVPFLRDYVYTVPVLPRGACRLDRHPRFCDALRGWHGAEIALHGLHHVRTGTRPVAEFSRRSEAACRARLALARRLFADAGLPLAPGLSPPGWEVSASLLAALAAEGFSFVASSRDLTSPVSGDARSNGSGLRGVPMLQPCRIDHGLLHVPTNFQATSTRDRALEILEHGGLLSMKSHLLAASGSYRALDGLTIGYRDHLHSVLSAIEDRFGESVWWTTMGEIASRTKG